MKKTLKIIGILLAILIIVLGIAWYLARKNAEKKGETPTTFSNFFGRGGSKTPGTDGNGSTLTSDFTNGTNGEGAGNEGDTDGNTAGNINGNNAGNTQSSQFTSGPFTPTGSTGSNGGVGGAASVNGNLSTINGNTISGSGTSSDSTNGSGGIGTGAGSLNPVGINGNGNTIVASTAAIDPGDAPECSDSDLNIAFEPKDLERLRILQQRFSTVASYLHTQNDLDVLQASFDTYQVKNEQLKELIGYCENSAPKISVATYPAFTRHVPTPFWHHMPADRFTDSGTFSEALATPPITGESASIVTNLTRFSASPLFSNTIISDLESWLRLNLW